jgi:hypothetical protein
LVVTSNLLCRFFGGSGGGLARLSRLEWLVPLEKEVSELEKVSWEEVRWEKVLDLCMAARLLKDWVEEVEEEDMRASADSREWEETVCRVTVRVDVELEEVDDNDLITTPPPPPSPSTPPPPSVTLS